MRSPVLTQSEALDAWAAGARGCPQPWELRWEQLDQKVQELQRQVTALAARASIGDPPAGGVRQPANAVAGRPRPLAAKAPSLDA